MCTPTLFESLVDAASSDGAVVPDAAFAGAHRLALDDRSWIEIVPGWLSGQRAWFDAVRDTTDWSQRSRRMYEQEIVEPRLTAGWTVDAAPDPSPHLAAVLGDRYGVRFDRVAANRYRDGEDSVAWHGDRVRFTHEAPVVAIVSLGAPRRFGLRPLGGGEARWLRLCGGDLLVMGGRCQHEWQHTVAKERGAGERISVTFRHADPGPAPRRAVPVGRRG